MDSSEFKSTQSSTQIDKPTNFGEEAKKLIEQSGWKGFFESVGIKVVEVESDVSESKVLSRMNEIMAQIPVEDRNKTVILYSPKGEPVLLRIYEPPTEGDSSK